MQITKPARRELLVRILGGALCGAVGAALLVALLGWTWPPVSGVVLSSLERGEAVQKLAFEGACMGGLAGLLIGWRRAGPVVAAVLPALLLVGLALAPREGNVRVDVAQSWAEGLVGGAVLLLFISLWPRVRVTVAAALALALIVATAVVHRNVPVAPAPPVGAPDVLVLTLDTVRADHFSFLGGPGPHAHTPHLDALAARSRVFRQAYAPLALTGPAHATLFSGISPREHGVRSNGRSLPETLPWVPEVFAAAGYHTQAWVSAAVLEGDLGFARGFAAYDSTFVAPSRAGFEGDGENRLRRGHGLLSWRGYRHRSGSAHHRGGADTVSAMHDHPVPADRPTFTWVHLYDAHWPYAPTLEAAERAGLADNTPLSIGVLTVMMQRQADELPQEEIERGRGLYRAGIDDLDAIVGRLLAAVSEDTVILVVGDHGESLGEHDYTFSHGRLPFAPDTRVPLMVAAPALSPAVVDHPVPIADVATTLLALAGLPIPSEVGGRSLLDPDPQRLVVSASWAAEFALPTTEEEDLGPWAGVAVRQGEMTAAVTLWDAEGLFQRTNDPSELTAVEVDDPAEHELIAALRSQLLLPVAGEAAAEPSMEAALEALGYIEGATTP